jgi:hypothetical protein
MTLMESIPPYALDAFHSSEIMVGWIPRSRELPTGGDLFAHPGIRIQIRPPPGHYLPVDPLENGFGYNRRTKRLMELAIMTVDELVPDRRNWWALAPVFAFLLVLSLGCQHCYWCRQQHARHNGSWSSPFRIDSAFNAHGAAALADV